MSYIHNEIIHNTSAAEVVVPKILDLIGPKSVVDVGCGIGTWLSVFEKLGVSDVIGIDGDYVDHSMLYINEDKFISANLTRPFKLNRTFDLVISLEVAEHLPAEAADTFIETLTSLGDTILFSAAIPDQGGQNHLNEQWPSYWQKLFAKRGFTFYDVIRDKIWSDPKVEWWYKQNTFLITKLKLPLGIVNDNQILSLIHPEMHAHYIKMFQERVASLENEKSKLLAGNMGIKISSKIFLLSIFNKIKSITSKIKAS